MKTLYKIGMLAVAVLAFVGCSKEVDNTVEQKTGTHTLSFTVQKDVDTRTAVVEGDGVASYIWTEGDEDYFVIFENDKKATSVEMTDLSSDHKIATFKATFNDSEATDFVYTAVYGSNVSNSKNPLIPYEQSPALKSFDPAADALVSAEEIALESGAKADENTEFKFKLSRVVSVNKMTLKGLVPGEKISRVELESTDSYFASRYRFDNKDYYTGSDGSKKLVFDYSKLNAVVGEDGTFPVYFTCAPVKEASFSVTVTTDGHSYTRDDFTSKLTLAVGTFRRFGINLAGYGEELQDGVEYKLVEDNKSIVDGAEYLIVSTKSNGGNVAASAYSSSFYSATDVTVSNKIISITSEEVTVFTLQAGETEGQFYMIDSEGKYVFFTGSSNNVSRADTKGNTTDYLWTITKDGITNVGATTRALKYNASSPRFACYTTAQTAIALYVNEKTLVERAEAGLSFDNAEVTVDYVDKDSFVSPTVNNPNNLTVTYSSSAPTVATVDAETGVITLLGDGETTITAVSESTDAFKAGSAQYKLIVTGFPGTQDNPYTVAEALAVIETLDNNGKTGNVYITGTVKSISELSTQYGNATYIITDSGSDITVFRGKYLNNAAFTSSDQLLVGDEVVIYGQLQKYFNSETEEVTPEVASGNYIFSMARPHFTVNPTSFDAVPYTGGMLTLTVNANVNWTVTVNNGATLKAGEAAAATSVSGDDNAIITITIPENEAGSEYSVSFSTTSDKVSAPEAITITQNKKPEDGEPKTQTIVWGTDLSANSGTVGDITFSSDKGNANNVPAYNASDKGMRVYQGSNVTFSVANGSITSIVFTVTGRYTGTNVTSDVGEYDAETKTWTGDSESVTIHNDKDKKGNNVQFRFTKVVITYK